MILNSNFINNYPFICLIISIILFLGLYQLGEYLLKIFSFEGVISKISNPNYQKIMVSTNFIMAFTMPFVLFTDFARIILILVATVLFLFGSVCVRQNLNIFTKLNKNFIRNKKITLDQFFVVFIIIGFF